MPTNTGLLHNGQIMVVALSSIGSVLIYQFGIGIKESA